MCMWVNDDAIGGYTSDVSHFQYCCHYRIAEVEKAYLHNCQMRLYQSLPNCLPIIACSKLKIKSHQRQHNCLESWAKVGLDI
jgi:hypothetical protein